MALEVHALEDGEWKTIKSRSPLYAQRFTEIHISGEPNHKEWEWITVLLMGRLSSDGKVILGGR